MKWTEQELQLIRQLYPTHTAQQLMPHLPGRTLKGIRQKAAEMEVGKLVHAPKFVRPIGSERMDRGHLIRKVTNTGQPKKDWKRVEVIEWEAVHGPIPPGMELMVKDASKPRTMDNLGLFTKADHWARVAAKTPPPEVLELYQLRARIVREVEWLSQQQAG
ncbi:hypothetical protein [Pulveribacter sp.]|uniref:hypothetical protein n=1 Tax=Pulveribacter sp. TaxID=2678893 RepID=UPI0028B11686|nr:hypothetical protein [Pulveribacter sp.]